VLYSTHSPYLIDPARLDRVRLVINGRDAKKAGTRVENKVHKGADHDTLTPIITAVGLDASRAFSAVAEKNVLTEGISDYYYLQAFMLLVSRSPDPHFIPCVGASKVPLLA